MRNIITASLIFILITFGACTGGDGDNQILKWYGLEANDLSDFTAYRGTDDGAALLNFETDSIRNIYINTYFDPTETVLKPRKYLWISMEFRDDHMVFVDLDQRKFISTYDFKGDSIFVNEADGEKRFVAVGTKEHLYRIESVSNYTRRGGSPVITLHKERLDKKKVFESAGLNEDGSDMNEGDEIMWCNVKFNFVK